jgi:putative transposon-encoded protein
MSETGSREQRQVGGKSPSREEEKPARHKVKFEVYGEEMLEKEVKYSGNSGRVYLPPEWVGKHIKVIRTN